MLVDAIWQCQQTYGYRRRKKEEKEKKKKKSKPFPFVDLKEFNFYVFKGRV